LSARTRFVLAASIRPPFEEPPLPPVGLLEYLVSRGLHLPTANATTDSDHPEPVYPNLLPHIHPTGPDQIWVADLPYIRLATRFVFFAVVLDTRTVAAIPGAHIILKGTTRPVCPPPNQQIRPSACRGAGVQDADEQHSRVAAHPIVDYLV